MNGDRVLQIGNGSIPAEAEDLGDTVLLPGLVNAHTHLEFSDLTNPIGHPGILLHDWIAQVVGTRQGATPESKVLAIQSGIRQLIDSGTRLAGEIATPPCEYPKARDDVSLVCFAEVLGLDPERAAERMDAAVVHNQMYPTAGLSPHAPYSTTLDAIDRCIDYASRFDRPIAMHVAESAAERELLTNGHGPFAEALQSMGVWREEHFPWGDDPFGMLVDRLAKAPRALLIHGNYLNEAEIEQLGKHRNLTVVYCPRTHHFFAHRSHPTDRMLSAGVRVALGTDSRASNPDLSIWKEVQHLLHHRSDIAPMEILRMATQNGADAMNQPNLGRIEAGCRPGLGIVRTTAANVDDVYADLSTNRYEPLRRGSQVTNRAAITPDS
jgi:cytosine/adenosine deaminase-related metal-dependent hydrolase